MKRAAMPIRLDARSADFPAKFRTFLDAKRETSADVEQAVRAIIADVAARGDAALIELTQKFDRVDLGTIGMRVRPNELEAATAACEPAARHEFDGLAKAGDATEDDIARAEKELDKLTHAQEAEIDKALEQKEQELLEV